MQEIETENQSQKAFSAWGLAWDLGWQISIPLVVFAMVGRFLDKYFDTSPWLLVAGVIIAAVTSTYMIYRKVVRILK